MIHHQYYCCKSSSAMLSKRRSWFHPMCTFMHAHVTLLLHMASYYSNKEDIYLNFQHMSTTSRLLLPILLYSTYWVITMQQHKIRPYFVPADSCNLVSCEPRIVGVAVVILFLHFLRLRRDLICAAAPPRFALCSIVTLELRHPHRRRRQLVARVAPQFCG